MHEISPKPAHATSTLAAKAPLGGLGGLGRLLQGALLACALFAGGALAATSCSGGSGDPCPGGVVVNGRCEGKCKPSLCVTNNTCVGNRCLLQCDSHADCYTGTQGCVPAKEDDTAKDIFVCKPSDRAALGTACPMGTECDGLAACPDGRACDLTQCGGGACTQDAKACAVGDAGVDPKCTVGKCDDGTVCTVLPCPAADCKPLACLTGGSADTTAFCTRRDCKKDADCAPGFYCGSEPDPHEICGSEPKKGNNGYCGKTTEPCVAAADFESGGLVRFEGPICLERRVCLKRSACTPCEVDLDCSLQLDHKCVKTGPDKRCLKACSKESDCTPGFNCVEGACAPAGLASTGCVATGIFCAPCRADEDCATVGGTPRLGCASVNGAGEKACFDPSFSTKCTTDADCPTSPTGKHGRCLGEAEDLTPADDVYHTCYFPFGADRFSCE